MRGFLSRRAGRRGRVGVRLGGRPRIYLGRSFGPYWAGFSVGAGGRRSRRRGATPIRRGRTGAVLGKRWYRRPYLYRYRRRRLIEVERHPLGRPEPLPWWGAAFVVVGSLLLFSIAVSWPLGLFYGALALLVALVRREHRKR